MSPTYISSDQRLPRCYLEKCLSTEYFSNNYFLYVKNLSASQTHQNHQDGNPAGCVTWTRAGEVTAAHQGPEQSRKVEVAAREVRKISKFSKNLEFTAVPRGNGPFDDGTAVGSSRASTRDRSRGNRGPLWKISVEIWSFSNFDKSLTRKPDKILGEPNYLSNLRNLGINREGSVRRGSRGGIYDTETPRSRFGGRDVPWGEL